jgi:formate C-acetyltransferase
VYNNYGIHGTGVASAADSLAAVEEQVFERRLPPRTLLDAMAIDYRGYEALRHTLRQQSPKVGNDDDRADKHMVWLLKRFADAVHGLCNERGGIFRAGTGSAMYYVWHTKGLGATADGRMAADPLPANYAPSLNIRLNGPTSLIRSFTKPDLSRVINGGPLTIEFHDTVFRTPGAIEKVAALVQLFVLQGGHQLQLNTVNRDQLLDAQAHPEQYRNLIVRVWGWSGYFVELDKCYQDHIISRVELTNDA